MSLGPPQALSWPADRDFQAEPWEALLATKLAHPRLPSALVARERLLRELETALAYRLTRRPGGRHR